MNRLFLTIVVVFFITGSINAQESQQQVFDRSQYRMRFNLNTIKQNDGSRLFEVKFYAQNKKDRKERLPVYQAKIDFINILDETEELLGSAVTSDEGIAQLILPNDRSYLKSENGSIAVKALYTDQGLADQEDDLSFIDLILEVELAEIDDVRTGIVKAFVLDSTNTKIPTDGIDLVISVGGMLSSLPIDEGTIEEGQFEFVVPDNLPGNENGELEIYATIEDHDDFWNVEIFRTANWGAPVRESNDNNYTLWSEVAPIWMYVVLTALLLGVWANYVYTIINLLKIRREGREIEIESND